MQLIESGDIKIIRAEIKHLELLVPLFDAYRIFYKQVSNLAKAKNFLQERLKNNESIIFIATDQTESIGYGFTQLYPSFTSVGAAKVMILNDLYVNPEHRRLKIASDLMAVAKDYCKKNKYMRITLQTASSNEAAQSLYQLSGYEKIQNDFLSYSLDLSSAEHDTNL